MMKAIRRILAWCGMLLLVIVVSAPCLYVARRAYFSRQEMIAKNICQQLLHRLDQFKKETGEYPRLLPVEWLPADLPSVIDRQRLYESDGSKFTFHFYNRSGFWDDVWVLHGTGTNWSTWDDDGWGAEAWTQKQWPQHHAGG